MLIDGSPEKSCQISVLDACGTKIETVEGLSGEHGLSDLQKAFIELQAGQCGYCLSGILMAATSLVRRNPAPSEGEVRKALHGNLCRCGSHARIVAAILLASTTGQRA